MRPPARSYLRNDATTFKSTGVVSGVSTEVSTSDLTDNPQLDPNSEWRGEVSRRLSAHRIRRRKPTARNDSQEELRFAENPETKTSTGRIGLADNAVQDSTLDHQFSFTIAIGRPAKKRLEENARMVIEVRESIDPDGPQERKQETACAPKLYPVATLEDRRGSAVIDTACLVFCVWKLFSIV